MSLVRSNFPRGGVGWTSGDAAVDQITGMSVEQSSLRRGRAGWTCGGAPVGKVARVSVGHGHVGWYTRVNERVYSVTADLKS